MDREVRILDSPDGGRFFLSIEDKGEKVEGDMPLTAIIKQLWHASSTVRVRTAGEIAQGCAGEARAFVPAMLHYLPTGIWCPTWNRANIRTRAT